MRSAHYSRLHLGISSITVLVLLAIALSLAACTPRKDGAAGDSTASPSPSSTVDTGTATPTTPRDLRTTVDDVQATYKGLGMLCMAPVRQDATPLWSCRKETDTARYFVEVAGTSRNEVTSVRATSTAHDGNADAIARPFLGRIASMKYEGAEPAAAKKWLEQHLGKNADTTIGGVPFELRGDAGVRSLTIGRSQ